jgi:hypothetical protein
MLFGVSRQSLEEKFCELRQEPSFVTLFVTFRRRASATVEVERERQISCGAAPQSLLASGTKEETMSPTRAEAILLIVFALFLLTVGVVLALDGFFAPVQEMMVATKVMGA